MYPFNLTLLYAVFFTLCFMLFMWGLHLRLKNAAWVDLGWVVSIVFMSAVYWVAARGFWPRRTFIFFMVFLWGSRLSWHLFKRLEKNPSEDTRYQQMRQVWGDRASFYFLVFFLFQGVLAVILSIPFFIASINPDEVINKFEFSGALLWIFAFIGEVASDAQLEGFKKNPANKGRVCQAGLWNYSRHPNYFFECLIWVSYFVFALGSPLGYFGLISPTLMIFFITALSGIPPAEAASLRSRGDLYRQYQKTTSVLIPWFKKKIS